MKVPSLSPNDTCSIRASKCVGETSLAAKLLCIPQARFIWNVFKLKYRKNLNNFKEWSEAPLHLFIPWWNLMDLPINQGFPSGSAIKNLPAMQETQETWFWSLGQEDPLEEGMATHSSILAWRIPWTEEPGGLTVHGVPKSQTWLSDLARMHTPITKFQIWTTKLILL